MPQNLSTERKQNFFSNAINDICSLILVLREVLKVKYQSLHSSTNNNIINKNLKWI